MKKLGGYKLIDFGGVDISTSKIISGIYNEIEKTEKRIVGCNLKIGTTTFKELTLDVKKVGTDYVLTNSVIKVVIGSDNAVVGLAFTDDNSSNKKIYCHPILLNDGSDNKIRIMCLIFNNDITKFTLTTFLDFLTISEGVMRIAITGTYFDNDISKVVIVSDIKVEGTTRLMLGYDTDGVVRQISLSTDSFPNLELEDLVNAIN